MYTEVLQQPAQMEQQIKGQFQLIVQNNDQVSQPVEVQQHYQNYDVHQDLLNLSLDESLNVQQHHSTSGNLGNTCTYDVAHLVNTRTCDVAHLGNTRTNDGENVNSLNKNSKC